MRHHRFDDGRPVCVNGACALCEALGTPEAAPIEALPKVPVAIDDDEDYHNAETEETTWDKPSTLHGTTFASDDWNVTVDVETGDTYYFNAVTRETTWDKPSELYGNSSLSNAWYATVDVESGDTYYFNALTRETTWEKPSELRELIENEAGSPSAVEVDQIASLHCLARPFTLKCLLSCSTTLPVLNDKLNDEFI
jgi:hypothetical protein